MKVLETFLINRHLLHIYFLLYRRFYLICRLFNEIFSVGAAPHCWNRKSFDKSIFYLIGWLIHPIQELINNVNRACLTISSRYQPLFSIKCLSFKSNVYIFSGELAEYITWKCCFLIIRIVILFPFLLVVLFLFFFVIRGW